MKTAVPFDGATMYTKEQIISEIKRVAKKAGTHSLSENDFQLNSTIPMTTVRFHLGSWPRALEEAGLSAGAAEDRTMQPPMSEEDLLKDLVRLFNMTGETPTRAVITEHGKYDAYHYFKRWKSINEAFLLARKTFAPETDPGTNTANAENNDPLGLISSSGVDFDDEMEIEEEVEEDLEKTMVSRTHSLEDYREIQYSKKPAPAIKTRPPVTKVKHIPRTFKPKNEKKGKIKGAPLQFRGLRFAPADRVGVIYLFGMISYELGFTIKSITSEFPHAEGTRMTSPDNPSAPQEHVRIAFEFKSSDFKVRKRDETMIDLLICWSHNWDDCPIEVLELESTLKILD